MEQLHVYLRGERVGTLMSDKGRLFFEYKPSRPWCYAPLGRK